MPTPPPSPRTELRRKSDRADYGRATIDAIVDQALICNIAFNHGGCVHCLPTSCWRVGDHLYIHGANNSRMAAALLAGECSVCIAHLDGLVLARSALHHSMNYRSVVIYGRFEPVTDPAYKVASLRTFIEGLYPGRWDTLRPISDKELNATTVLRIALDEASAKVRDWGVKDDEEDLEWPVWAGVIPLRTMAGEPVTEADSEGREVPRTRFG